MKKVSIITINLNNAAGLRASAESIVSQSCYNEIEWIVIDGASTDGSVEVIHDFAPYIHYWVSEKDSGIYHAMNKGILAAHGEYVLFRNSGDLMSNNRVIEQFIEHPAYGKFDHCSGITENMRHGKWLYDFYPAEELTLKAFYGWSMPHASTFTKRSRFENHLYDQGMKICADNVFYFEDIIMRNASYKALDFKICKFETTGVSSGNPKIGIAERDYGVKKNLPPRIYKDLCFLFCNLKGREQKLMHFVWSRTWEYKILCYVAAVLSIPRRILNYIRRTRNR